MLLGRETAQVQIHRLIMDARRGRSGALVISGEAGSGKSRLLAHARARADGMSVAAARGLESEAQLPFAGLSELLAPLLEHLEAVPEPQRAALERSLALRPTGPAGRFAAYSGVRSLLAAAAHVTPVLMLVDDAHWLDAPSAEALVFAGRRLGEERVAMLVAVGEGGRQALVRAGLPERRLGAAVRAARGPDEAGPRTGRPQEPAISSLLTAHELRVARTVADGARTKEVAAALFVSPRTIDAHLHRIYRKLGIRSRSELTRLVVEDRLLAG